MKTSLHRSLHRSLHLLALALTLMIATVLSSSSRAHAQALKIAVVDMQRAMNDTEDGRKAKGNLKKLFEERQKQLDKAQNDLKSMKDSLEKQRDVLSRDVLAKKLEEYQKAFAELQQTYMEFQRELGSKEGELTKDIVERMQRIVRHIGQAEGYTLILERNEAGVIYTPSTYDLTDVLIARYNTGEGRSETVPQPKLKSK